MSEPATVSRLYSFGVFKADCQSGELYRNGQKVKLSGQPFEVLAMLLQRPGQLVTREELRKKLWPEDTFVDFDHSLNTAINKIRESLGDSAENPHFVETLPRRGYRFIARLEPVAPVSSPAAAVAASMSAVARASRPCARPGWPCYIRSAVIDRRYSLRRQILALAVGGVMVVAALLVGLNVAGLRDRAVKAMRARHGAPVPKIESIAVLPLENLSNDPDQEYFADGMTEALITNLGKIRALRVISRTTAMHFKGTKKTLPEIARELNVDAVVEGSVLRSGSRVRVTANLLHAPTDRHLWANTYEREMQDVLALQAEVARAIAEEVRIKLTPEEKARLATTRPVKPEAYEAYLKGLQSRRWGAMGASPVSYFAQAIEKDPTYAPAFAELALHYAGDFDVSYEEAYPRAAAAASKALQLDETLAEAHAAEAAVNLRFRWDWRGAESEYRRAGELTPSMSGVHASYGDYLTFMGRFEDAFVVFRRAIRLEPLNPIGRFDLAWVYCKARRYDEAIASLRDQIEVDPDWPLSHYLLAHAYAGKGMYVEAVGEAEKAKCWSWCGWLYAVAGKQKEARAILQELIRHSKQRYVDPGFIAFTYAGLGEREKALDWLEEGYRRRARWMIYIGVTPEADPLRPDPRFQDLLRRMNFPP